MFWKNCTIECRKIQIYIGAWSLSVRASPAVSNYGYCVQWFTTLQWSSASLWLLVGFFQLFTRAKFYSEYVQYFSALKSFRPIALALCVTVTTWSFDPLVVIVFAHDRFTLRCLWRVHDFAFEGCESISLEESVLFRSEWLGTLVPLPAFWHSAT